jgi:hypothetical protein
MTPYFSRYAREGSDFRHSHLAGGASRRHDVAGE